MKSNGYRNITLGSIKIANLKCQRTGGYLLDVHFFVEHKKLEDNAIIVLLQHNVKHISSVYSILITQRNF